MIRLIKFCFLVFILSSCASTSSKDSGLGYKGKNGNLFGYQTVTNAIEKLGNIEGSQKRTSQGWTVISIESQRTIWTFPPNSHPAYPSAVKRALVEENGTLYLETDVSCGASKSVCDKLVHDYIKLNEKIKPGQTNSN